MPCYCYVSISDQLGPSAFNKFDLLLFDLITCFLLQINVFLNRLTGQSIGYTVVGIIVIDKTAILTV